MENIKYKIVNETSYHENTPEAIIDILEHAMKTRKRIRIFYGDTETGRDWMEIYDTIGTVGRSCGQVKIPLLIKSSRSCGGMPILDHCIVKITIDKITVYQNPKYYLPKMEIKKADEGLITKGYLYSVLADGNCIYNCKELKQAENEILFHKGFRNKIA